jgi:hypothetical protein
MTFHHGFFFCLHEHAVVKHHENVLRLLPSYKKKQENCKLLESASKWEKSTVNQNSGDSQGVPAPNDRVSSQKK